MQLLRHRAIASQLPVSRSLPFFHTLQRVEKRQEDLMQHFHPWRVQAKIFDFVKVTEGAQQPKQSI
ncbi:MAG: hypothetical protein LBS91_04975, partial [Clostridiales Family XIII bacterium]|nr:hypothetical protein [Clostridiales Family XIII bacterium]